MSEHQKHTVIIEVEKAWIANVVTQVAQMLSIKSPEGDDVVSGMLLGRLAAKGDMECTPIMFFGGEVPSPSAMTFERLDMAARTAAHLQDFICRRLVEDFKIPKDAVDRFVGEAISIYRDWEGKRTHSVGKGSTFDEAFASIRGDSRGKAE